MDEAIDRALIKEMIKIVNKEKCLSEKYPLDYAGIEDKCFAEELQSKEFQNIKNVFDEEDWESFYHYPTKDGRLNIPASTVKIFRENHGTLDNQYYLCIATRKDKSNIFGHKPYIVISNNWPMEVENEDILDWYIIKIDKNGRMRINKNILEELKETMHRYRYTTVTKYEILVRYSDRTNENIFDGIIVEAS